MRDAAPRLLAMQGVVGVAESSQRGEPCVLVYVSDEATSAIPSNLHGYEVVIRRSGEIHAQEADGLP